MSATPLGLGEFAATVDSLARFESHPLIAVAVSGGPDSLALVILADRWVRQRGGIAWALTVDHGLRRESGAEAARVAQWMCARGIPHEILVWSGAKPLTGLQEAAREARYRLLAEWCCRRGCLHLLTAHHREDQIETHLIRRRARSGAAGLAGMPVVRELPFCRVLRPLLGVAKSRLLALLGTEGQPFISDPSNRDPAFERARLRLVGDALPLAVASGRSALGCEIRALGERRRAAETARDSLVARTARLHPAGFVVLDPEPILAGPAETAERVLGRVALAVGGARYPPRCERLARLREGLVAAPTQGRTLGGCRFVLWRGRLLVIREMGAAAPPLRLVPGEEALWDRRFAVALPEAAPEPVTLFYLGQAGPTERARLAPHLSRTLLPPLLYPILPAFRDEAGQPCVFSWGEAPSPRALKPQLIFRPAMSLTDAGFTVV